MQRIVLLGYLFILGFSGHAKALIPVEGILMGEAVSEYQQDPLYYIFNDIYDKSKEAENRKMKLYQNTHLSGAYLKESCNLYVAPTYATNWMEKQAKRSVAATLQYIGLDTSIKAIGAYAHRFQIPEEKFKTLATNLVSNYCSKNITIFSLKRLEQSFQYYFKNPVTDIIPSVESSPFVSDLYKRQTESTQAKSNEFDMAIRNFRSFCSWGGDVVDYRMMVPYLKNPFIMSFVIKNLNSIQDRYDHQTQRTSQSQSKDTVQVECKDLICRKTDAESFKRTFPESIGSTGLFTDVAKLYCHHFRFTDYVSAGAVPQVKAWIKKQELEDPIFETSFFISLMTGVPDPIFGVDTYRDLPMLAKSTIDERWNRWAKDALSIFSKNMLFEESLNIKAHPRRDKVVLRTEGFLMDFFITLGEMDRVVDETDKLTTSFDLKLSKNFLRHVKNRWTTLNNQIDLEGKEKFIQETSSFIDIQLKEKEKLFRQKMWNENFSRLIVQELIGQLQAYRGPLFESYQDQVLRVPVKFSYGIFALSYLRYRADVKAGRLKLNL